MSASPSVKKRTIEDTDISPIAPDSKQQKGNAITMEGLIQSLQATINTLSTEVSALKSSNDDLKTTVDNLNSSVSALKTELKNTTESLTENSMYSMKLSEKISALESENKVLRQWIEQIEDKITSLEYHQRRNNLVFEGIPEPVHKESGQEIFSTLIGCLSNVVDTTGIRIARCHRLGPYKAGVNRNIIANFLWYGDITDILANKKRLPKGVYVKTDIPKVWDDRMRMLRPMYKALRDDPKVDETVSLSKGKLFVGKSSYTPNMMSDLANRFPNANPCEKEDENTIGFLGPYSPFSNMNLCKFKVDNVEYKSAEHYIQSKKASLFNDDVMEAKILVADTPFEAKSLSKQIKEFNAFEWEKHAEKVATTAVTAKFSQNSHLMERLMGTNKSIVECSPDIYWGTGVSLKSANALNESAWTGRGLMCIVYTNVRENIKQLLAAEPPPS